MSDYVQATSVDQDTVIDSGATGGGVLVRGQSCSGWYVTCPAVLADGREVEITAEHLYGASRRLVRATATLRDDPDTEVEGPAVREWLDALAAEYEAAV